MSTKKKQIGFYADEDVESFLSQLDPGVKTKTINEAIRAWSDNQLTGDAIRKMQDRLICLQNNHIQIGQIVWDYVKKRGCGDMQGLTDLDVFLHLIERLSYEQTGLILGPDEYAQYQLFDPGEMLLINNGIEQAQKESIALSEKYKVVDHQEYAKHYQQLAADLENLKTRLQLTHRIKRHSFEAGLLSEALTCLSYASRPDSEAVKNILKLRDKLFENTKVTNSEDAACDA